MKYVAVCKAVYDYEAQTPEEVSIKEDDIVYVVDNSDPSWSEVQLKMPSVDQIGPVGLVPASYVAEVCSIWSPSSMCNLLCTPFKILTLLSG